VSLSIFSVTLLQRLQSLSRAVFRSERGWPAPVGAETKSPGG
jgi:hypothetical protein